jgi:hypothetical protein
MGVESVFRDFPHPLLLVTAGVDAGGFATVAGRGVPLGAIELSLSRDAGAIALQAPEPWADA